MARKTPINFEKSLAELEQLVETMEQAGLVGPLQPINETEIVILSGAFAGETMVYEPETGNLYHQSIVFKPSEPDLKR